MHLEHDAPAPADDPRADASDPAAQSPRAALLLAWGLLWVILALAAGQGFSGAVGAGTAIEPPWRLWLGEACAAVGATAVLLLRLRALGRDATLQRQPRRWARAALLRLPLDLVLYLIGVLVLAVVVQGLLGHDPAVTGAPPELPDTWLLFVAEPRRLLDWLPWLGGEALRFLLCMGTALAVLYALRRHGTQAAERLRGLQVQGRADRARLLQLGRQLDPAFLSEALNTVSAAVHDDPDAADRMIGRLTALLRAADDPLRWPEVPLAEELRLLEAYGEIVGARHADRVTLGFEIDPFARDCPVPTMALQPLLEHAFRHGVERWSGHATIVVRAFCEPGRLELAVDDNVGQLPDALLHGDGTELDALPADTRGGLEHLRARLRALHGPQALLRLLPREGGGISARLSLPCASC